MKKSLMSNIKHFVDSNVRQRIDRASNNNNEFIGEDIILIEKHFEDIRHVCSKAGKTISALLQSTNSASNIYSVQNVQASINNLSNLANVNHHQQNLILSPSTATTSCAANTFIRNETLISHSSNQSTLTKSNKPNSQAGQDVIKNGANFHQNPLIDSNDSTSSDIRKHKKLPVVGFLKFLVKSCQKLKSDSLLHTTLLHCSQLQTQLTKLYLSYEQTVEIQCLRPIQQILEIDAPNVIKLRKLFIKSHNDLESVKAKYNGASQKQQQQQLQTGHLTSTSYTISQSAQQQANINKLDQLKKELDDAITRFEQARDTYATELYAFVCRETELVNLFMKFYQYQADYQQQVANAIQGSLPSLSNTLATTPRRLVFSTPLEEHLRCTGRNVSLVIELCIHLLYSNALHEEGLFRIPGSSVKIKKLKNAINAWFVTLASQTELESDQHEQLVVGSQSPSLLAIYALFKDIVSQKKPSETTTSVVENSVTAINQSAITTPTATIGREDSTLTHTNLQSTILSSYSQEPSQQQQFLVFDVHTIAGLLKLYLRELKEPLFTYALYDQWIDATVKTLNPSTALTATQSNSSEPTPSVQSSSITLKALEQVVEQLPKANYDNLRLLIRFLHILTCHQEFNRMTATNLAITMAPSLIWSKPAQSVQPPPTGQEDNNSTCGVVGEQTQMDEMHALNMQMSSVGISASLHALVIENLISHAEILFPGQMCFTLPGLDEQIPTTTTSTNKVVLGGDDQKVVLSKLAASAQGRCIKSTSPTGLSTASSSSFSSTTSVTSSSATTTNKIKHSRKGGSMDGLLNDVNTNTASITLENSNTNNRPMSVHLNQQQHSSFQPKQFQQQQPPPVPPAPAARSHSRQASESSTSSCTVTNRSPGGGHKQLAPVPPPCALKRQPKITASSDQLSDYRARAQSKQQQAAPPVIGTSLRGTGIIAPPPPQAATRPNVPPPNRPKLGKERATSSSFEALDNDTQQSENTSSSSNKMIAVAATKFVTDSENNLNQGDNKSSDSVTSSGNLRADFEEINAADVDDIDSSAPISPIISLESISGGDGDSSFDDDCPSLEHSWTECELGRDGERNQARGMRKNSGEPKIVVVSSANDEDSRCETLRGQIKPVPRKRNNLVNDGNTKNGIAEVEISTSVDRDDDEEETLTAPPIKPSRSTSPKVTQSTPL